MRSDNVFAPGEDLGGAAPVRVAELHDFTSGDASGRAFDLLFSHPSRTGPFVAVAFLVALVTTAIDYAFEFEVAPYGMEAVVLPVTFVLMMVSFVARTAFVRDALALQRGLGPFHGRRLPDPRELGGVFLLVLLRAFLLSPLVLLAVMPGMVAYDVAVAQGADTELPLMLALMWGALCCVPLVYVYFGFALVAVCFLDGTPMIECFQRSWGLMQGRRWTYLGTSLRVGIGAALLSLFTLGVLAQARELFWSATDVAFYGCLHGHEAMDDVPTVSVSDELDAMLD